MKRLILLLAAGAAALSVADYLAWRASHRALSAVASRTGLFERLPQLRSELRRETEPARAATRLAWSLLDLEVDRGWLEELPPQQRRAEAERGLERLGRARRLAEEILPRLPSSWRAATVLGMTRYLEAERTGERDRPSSYWRRPLLTAMELAPAMTEPPLLLALASLSRWSALSPAEREATMPVLARALEEPVGLELLVEPWSRLAPSLDRLLEVIPDRPAAWQALERVFLARGDLERYAAAHRRWLDAQPAFLAEQLKEARRRRRGGDARSAAGRAGLVIGAPADRALADSVPQALALLMPGPQSERARRELRRWTIWALDLCLLGDCPLEPPAIARLAALAGGLHPAQAGMVALAAGDLAGALEQEAAAPAEPDPEWQRYWIYKAARLAVSDPGAARQALDRASPGGPTAAPYWRSRETLAGDTDSAEAALARRELERLARGGWSASDWSVRPTAHRLILFSAGPSQGLRLELASLPPEGGAMELRWDGGLLGVATVRPGEELVWRLDVAPGLHQLELSSLSGRQLRPGALKLEQSTPIG